MECQANSAYNHFLFSLSIISSHFISSFRRSAFNFSRKKKVLYTHKRISDIIHKLHSCYSLTVYHNMFLLFWREGREESFWSLICLCLSGKPCFIFQVKAPGCYRRHIWLAPDFSTPFLHAGPKTLHDWHVLASLCSPVKWVISDSRHHRLFFLSFFFFYVFKGNRN